MLYYCKKCGRIIIRNDWDKKICDVCQSTLYPVPKKYVYDDCPTAMINSLEDEFKQKYIFSSPEFDPKAHKLELQRIERCDKEWKERQFNIQHYGTPYPQLAKNKNIHVPKCPTCGSTNVQKIGNVEKAVSAGVWGLFSTKIRKSYKCNNCKYMW